MTFAALFAALTSRKVLPRPAAAKTALRKLAHALGGTLETCQAGASYLHEEAWLDTLDAAFDAAATPAHPISAYTRRNTRYELRAFFDLAKTHGVLVAPLPLLAPMTRTAFVQHLRATNPYPLSYPSAPRPEDAHYGLWPADWPPDIVQGWHDYQHADGPPIRNTTYRGYETCLASFFGYVQRHCGRPATWEALFDIPQLKAFVAWHATRMGQSDGEASHHGWHLVIVAAAIAQRTQHPDREALARYRRTVRRPGRLHDKREYHWLSLKQLDAIGNRLLAEGRRPYLSHTAVHSPGVRGATRFQRGLLIKFLTRIPLRSRNIREMRLGRHLRKNRQGHWVVKFSGAELKVALRNGATHVYEVDVTRYCPPDKDDLIPTLEEFLTDYRPRLPGATPTGYVFLTQLGTRFTDQNLGRDLSTIIARHGGGQRVHPHMFRSIFATEMLEKEVSIRVVAEILGDTIPVVSKMYDEINRERELAIASDAIYTMLHGD